MLCGFLAALISLAAAPARAETAARPVGLAPVAELVVKLYPTRLLPSDLVSCLRNAPLPFQGRNDSAFLVDAAVAPRVRVIGIELVDTRLPNAFAIESDETTAAKIRISTALLDRIEDEDSLAFILAHEMYHLQSGKVPTSLDGILLTPRQLSRIAETHQRWEAEADADAARVVLAAGYSVATGGKVLALLRPFDQLEGALPRSHPAIDVRLQALARLVATTS